MAKAPSNRKPIQVDASLHARLKAEAQGHGLGLSEYVTSILKFRATESASGEVPSKELGLLRQALVRLTKDVRSTEEAAGRLLADFKAVSAANHFAVRTLLFNAREHVTPEQIDDLDKQFNGLLDAHCESESRRSQC